MLLLLLCLGLEAPKTRQLNRCPPQRCGGFASAACCQIHWAYIHTHVTTLLISWGARCLAP